MPGNFRTGLIALLSGGALLSLSLVGVRAGQQKAASPAPTPQQIQFFESKVRPVLVNNCFMCHGNGKHTADISLDSLANVLKGNAHGPSVVPGDPDKSSLVQVIGYAGKIKMPPSGKLRPEEVAALMAWVKMGAPWPDAAGKEAKGAEGGGAPAPRPSKVVSEADKQRWPFKSFQKPGLPVVKDKQWAKNPVDLFVLAQMEAKGLKPAAPATRRDLIRRAYFDLIGLPPTPKQVDAFLADKSSDAKAFAKVVDELLASPHYGERWGRHWLDVVRYADSNGLDENTAFGNAWRYRDYVVNAFNKDKPYDQFIKEQLAGDLLPSATDEERNEHLTATGFLSLGPKVLAEPDKAKMMMDIVDEQIEVTSKTFLGLTVACARCHDHKFDPIPTKDYYALAGIFKSTRTMENLNTVARCYERPLVSKEDRSRLEEDSKKAAELEGAVKRETGLANQAVITEQQSHLAKYLLAGYEMSQQKGGGESLAELPAHPGDVRIFVDAVKYNRGNANRDTDNYGKGIGVIHTTERPTFAEYDIDVPKAGNYQIELRYAAQDSRPIHLAINGKTVKEDAASKVTGSWFPEGQRWDVQGVFSLHTGKNTVRLENGGDIPHINRLLVASIGAEEKGNGKPVRTAEQIAADSGLNPGLVRLWSAHMRGGQSDPVLGPFLRFAKIPAAQFAQQAPTVSAQLAASGALPAIVTAFQGFNGSSLAQVAAVYEELFKRAMASNRSADKTADLVALRTSLTGKNGLLAAPNKPETYYAAETAKKIADLNKMVAETKNTMRATPVVLAVEEASKIENCRVHLRGDTQNLGDEVPRHFLTVVADGEKVSIDKGTSGRLDLAKWLTQPTHPLTGRVEINRIWQEHFGVGFTRTPDNFGLLGEKPSHPELLDWLSSTFVEKGWSIKQIHRLIMLSSTYQQSTTADPKTATVDPDNRLLSHFNRRRLEAEPFRDSLLYVSGKLEESFGGTLLGTPNFGYVTNDQSGNGANYNAPRRSIYLPIIRNALFDMFQAFDMGDPSIVNAHRSTTTVATQALYMMNSPFVMEQARAFADELEKTGKSDAARLNEAYLRAYSRPASPAEVAKATAFLSTYEAKLEKSVPDVNKRKLIAWQSLCQVILAANEFIYVN